MDRCILCHTKSADTYFTADGYDYLHCSVCDLIFVKPGQRLDPDEEKSRYDLHENDPSDPHYREFLSQLFDPLSAKLKPGSFGLDFGSGPGPTLHVMFEEAGHHMNIYDPFYANHPAVLEHSYDFITTTETAEHLFHPRKEFDRLWKILKPGGYLGMMTKIVPSLNEFPDWHYRKDDTHVTFYSEKTFAWIARLYHAEFEIFGERTVIFKKLT
jgi:SAM-dependent methyltransferase